MSTAVAIVEKDKRRKQSPATQLARRCRVLIASGSVDCAGLLLGTVFASLDGLRLLAKMYAENMHTHVRFARYEDKAPGGGIHAMQRLMIDDVVGTIARTPPYLVVYATLASPVAWSLTMSVVPNHAPMTLVVSSLPTLAKQALANLLAKQAFTEKGDPGVAWVRFTHFRYGDILRAAYSPAVVIAAILLHAVSGNVDARAQQLPIYYTALCEQIPGQRPHPHHTPPAMVALCERNTRHMQEAAALFAVAPDKWSWRKTERAIARMANECALDIEMAIKRRVLQQH